MDSNTIQALLDINRQFYQNFAGAFAQTRQRIQPGARQVIASLPLQANLLDLGCGNAELAIQLARRGQQGVYLGLDFSRGLLQAARSAWQRLSAPSLSAKFTQFDLASAGQLPALARDAQPLTAVLSFAVLHHIPGTALRLELLRQIHQVLAAAQPGAHFIFSVWQFLRSPRLAARSLPWESVGLSSAQVDAGDYLMDWRREGNGVRYVHHFSQAELQLLADTTHFRVMDSFSSDGQGGNLGLYQVWEPLPVT